MRQGGGNVPDDGDEDMEDNDSDESSSDAPNKGDLKDPKQGGTGKFYKAQTQNGKKMVKMFKRCCDLTDRDTNAIVVYFGIYSEASLIVTPIEMVLSGQCSYPPSA